MFAAAVLADQTLITESQNLHVGIELGGNASRGHNVIDWYSRHTKKINAEVVLALD